MKKLPKKFKKKWVAALRSREYQQGSGSLYDRFYNEYCCLGVACVIAGVKPDSRGVITFSPNKKNIGNIPKILKGDVDKNQLVNTLTGMNDGSGKYTFAPQSFLEIADWIQKNL